MARMKGITATSLKQSPKSPARRTKAKAEQITEKPLERTRVGYRLGRTDTRGKIVAVAPELLDWLEASALADQFNLEVVNPEAIPAGVRVMRLRKAILDRLKALRSQPEIPEMGITVYIVISDKDVVLMATLCKRQAEIYRRAHDDFHRATDGSRAMVLESEAWIHPATHIDREFATAGQG